MSEISGDWWTQEGVDLLTPKYTVGEYVESQGFRVPRRFDSLDEALQVVKSGGGIVLRSEHPDEYEGASGMFQTYFIDGETANYAQKAFKDYGRFDVDEQVYLSQDRSAITACRRGDKPGYRTMQDVVLGLALETPSDITIQRLLQLTGQHATTRRYADLTGKSLNDLMREASFSFWEEIPGLNVTVIADSAIDNRFHVLANKDGNHGIPSYYGWQIAKEDGISSFGKANDTVLTPETTARLVKFYESIRNLPRFSSEHCPIIEMQMDEQGDIWFLQYHRTQDFTPVSEVLSPADFSSEEGWRQVDGVRGALGSIATLKMSLWYPKNYGSIRHGGLPLPDAEDASTDWHWDWSLSEMLSRRRTAHIIDESRARYHEGLASAHSPRSKWFKPLTAVACNDRGLEKLVPEALKKEVSQTVNRKGKFVQLVIDLAVDGNVGYIRLNPESEQPLES